MLLKKLLYVFVILGIFFKQNSVFAEENVATTVIENVEVGSKNAINVPEIGASLMNDAIVQVVEKTLPAVVTLSVSKKVKVPVYPSIESLFFGSIFESFNDIISNYSEYKENIVFSSGTGFLISDSGYILTNYHNVESAISVSVVLSDNRQFDAKIIGVDPSTDLAVVKIETGKEIMPYLTFSEKNPRAGEWVISIGNRLSLGNAVSLGVISSVMSCPFSGIAGVNYLGSVIQTDAIMASGSSGGALIDPNGKVVGVNFAAISSGSNSVGVSYFAIPASVAENISSILAKGQEVKRGYIGIICQDVTKEIANALGLEKIQGTIVSDILDGSPAQKAGLKIGDIIVQFNEKDVLDNKDLATVVSNCSTDKSAKILIKRAVDGMPVLKEHVLKIFIGTSEEKKKMEGMLKNEINNKKNSEQINTKLTADELGVDVIDLDNNVRKNLKIDELIKGVLIVNVNNSHENVKSLLKGDIITKIITRIDKFDIPDKESLIQVINNIKILDIKYVMLNVMRGKQSLFIGVNISSVEDKKDIAK